MRLNKPINGFFEWADQFLANASAKVFEPFINANVGAGTTIITSVGKGVGGYLEDPENIKNLVNTGIASQTGGLVGLGGSGSGSNEYETENNYQSDSEKNTKIAKYILGGVAILGVGYLIIKDK